MRSKILFIRLIKNIFKHYSTFKKTLSKTSFLSKTFYREEISTPSGINTWISTRFRCLKLRREKQEQTQSVQREHWEIIWNSPFNVLMPYKMHIMTPMSKENVMAWHATSTNHVHYCQNLLWHFPRLSEINCRLTRCWAKLIFLTGTFIWRSWIFLGCKEHFKILFLKNEFKCFEL